MEITKTKTHLIVKIPLKQRRSNPWDENFNPEMNNLIGIIANQEYTLNHLIDMNYKDKPDQIGQPVLWFNDEKELRNICNKCGFDIEVLPVCAYCGKVIWGSFSIGEKGNMCFDCELKEKTNK